MKKKLLVGMLAMVLVLGMVLVGCATTPKGPVELPNLDGTWKDTWNNASESGTFFFTGSNYSYQNLVNGEVNKQFSSEGTFTLTEKQISFVAFDGKKWKQGYKVSGDRLKLAEATGHDYGEYVKQ
ncbi:hypothetical protein AGMMS49942_21870 [Spirochaetia bacterium]|nr:hypothetical protein AGMMS49942_21870 [Spirochaetia bacterium]